MGDITWTNDRVRLGDLRPWDENPRLIRKRQAQRLLQSWEDFGQVQTIAIGPGNEVYDGHQRLSALLAVHGPDYMVDVRRASRTLSDVERRALVLSLHAGATGSWDWDTLANWDPAELQGGGLDEEFLDELKRAQSFAIELLELSDAPMEWDEAFANLPDEDRPPFQQMTFTLHDDQAEIVREALEASKALGPFDGPNENSNGNALARICEIFLQCLEGRGG